MLKLILSAVGTSLFTNIAGKNRSTITKYANDKEDVIPEDIKELVAQYVTSIQALFANNDIGELKASSAELNSLLTFYNNRFEGNERDVHILIATDTYLGKQTARLIESYLNRSFQTVILFTPKDLSTQSKESFQSGIRDLLKWCDNTLNEYKDAEYEIIFNLTGGFKSLQGYLNTIGMFYADKIIYIFERANELITIPRLPIKIETDLFDSYASLFLQLSQTNKGIEHKVLTGLPEIMIETYDKQKYILSDWGELSWNNTKEDVLAKKIFELPAIHYSPSFIKDFQNTDRPDDKVKLQETIAKISCLLQENDGDISSLKGGRAGGVLYDNYSGKNANLGHFRINGGTRVSCEYKNRMLELRHYGQHDYVNDNP